VPLVKVSSLNERTLTALPSVKDRSQSNRIEATCQRKKESVVRRVDSDDDGGDGGVGDGGDDE
jgi:hypothetical protein